MVTVYAFLDLKSNCFNGSVAMDLVRSSRLNSVIRMASNQSSAQDSSIASTIYYNVHKGDTLTLIAKRYRTSVLAIAEANDIVDVDFLQEGQVLFIPLHRRLLQKTTSGIGDTEEKPSLKFNTKRLPPKTRLTNHTADSNTTLSATEIPPITFFSFVNAAGPIFFLASVFGFAVRFIIESYYRKLRSDVSKHPAEKVVWDIQHRPKVKRWQTILDEDRETEEFGSVHERSSQVDLIENETEEQRKKREFDEIRDSYSSLETTYMTFLADSGLSKSGYWRGGVPPATQDGDTG